MSEARKALRRFVRNNLGGYKTFIATVSKVNTRDCTCNIIPVDGNPEIFNAKLKPGIGGEYGVFALPAIGSDVIAAELGDENNVCVLAVEQADKYIVKTKDGEIELNGSQYSMVKSEVLEQELNKLNSTVEALKKALTTWVVAPGDGGAALKLAVTTTLTGLASSDFSKISNKNVKHG